MTPQPLSEAEFDSLSEALERLGAMNLEQLDGFLASLVCGPEEVSKSECLQEVCGFDVMNHAEAASEPTTRTLLALLSRHRDSIAHTLRSGDVFTPLLVADEQGEYPANDWAKGFLRGMERNRGKFPGPLTLACHYDGAGRISSARCGIWAPGMPRRSPKNS